jgi:hypothetical protein
MNRRNFLRIAAAAAPAFASSTHPFFAQTRGATDSGAGNPGWRTYEIRTKVSVLRPSGETRIWLPFPLAVGRDTVFLFGTGFMQLRILKFQHLVCDDPHVDIALPRL